MLRVAIFDDVLAARGEVFHIPGLEVTVYADADDVEAVVRATPPPDVVCMDFAMGTAHMGGAEAVRVARGAGYHGRIVAMSSDDAANQQMIDAGADEALPRKAVLRSFLVSLGKE